MSYEAPQMTRIGSVSELTQFGFLLRLRKSKKSKRKVITS